MEIIGMLLWILLMGMIPLYLSNLKKSSAERIKKEVEDSHKEIDGTIKKSLIINDHVVRNLEIETKRVADPWAMASVFEKSKGKKLDRLLKDLKIYQSILEIENPAKISDLALAVGKSENEVILDLRKLMGEGAFKEPRIDSDNRLMFVTYEAYNEYQKKKHIEKESDETKFNDLSSNEKEKELPLHVKQRLEEGEKYLASFSVLTDKISSSSITDEMIDTIVSLEKIFLFVKNHPDDVSDTDHLFKYYLPTTIKFLETYVELESGSIKGENSLKSKEEIERTLCSLNSAYKVMVDDMYQDTTMDIISDASVIETLLTQQGLKDKPICNH